MRGLPLADVLTPPPGAGDGRAVSAGFRGQTGSRNSPRVYHAAGHVAQFWDGRAASLEEQAAGPIANPIEMNLPHAECLKRLNADAEYKALFAKAFGEGDIAMVHVTKAIAAYERTVVSGNSPFDRYQYGGDKKAISESAARGLARNSTDSAMCSGKARPLKEIGRAHV